MTNKRPVMIRLPDEVYRMVKALADREERPVAQWCAMAVRDAAERAGTIGAPDAYWRARELQSEESQ